MGEGMMNMTNISNGYPHAWALPHYANYPQYGYGGHPYWNNPYEGWDPNRYQCPQPPYYGEGRIQLKDYGTKPFVVDIEKATKKNRTFRTALWTGNHLQVTLMSIGVGEDIGLEVHPDVDQFLRIEEGQGLTQMGDSRYQINFQKKVADDDAIMIPAGKWHNLINTGNKPLKLYSIYAPPEHPFGTVHPTKADAMAAE